MEDEVIELAKELAEYVRSTLYQDIPDHDREYFGNLYMNITSIESTPPVEVTDDDIKIHAREWWQEGRFSSDFPHEYMSFVSGAIAMRDGKIIKRKEQP